MTTMIKSAPLPDSASAETATHRHDTHEEKMIREVADAISRAQTKGELGIILAREIGRYSLHDLQVIGGRLHAEMVRLPQPYRHQLRPYLTDQIFGAHHQLLSLHRTGKFSVMTILITDIHTFRGFCAIIPDGCLRWEAEQARLPVRYTPWHRLFYYLIAAHTMFIMDQPGHPVGTPFPGGFKVEERNGSYYCLIRDHEKEVPHSLCNFCPALQSPDDEEIPLR